MLIARPDKGFRLSRSNYVSRLERGIRMDASKSEAYDAIIENLVMNAHRLGDAVFEGNSSLRHIEFSTKEFAFFFEYAVIGDLLEILIVDVNRNIK